MSEAITLESLNAKLDTLLAIAQASGTPPTAKAYDRPELSVDQITAFDGHTVNADGSIWGVSNYPQQGVKIREYFGYISPAKTPDIWTAGLKLLGPERFAVWEAGWKANPYGVYHADIRAELANGVANFMLFSMAYGQPARTVVQ